MHRGFNSIKFNSLHSSGERKPKSAVCFILFFYLCANVWSRDLILFQEGGELPSTVVPRISIRNLVNYCYLD